MKNIKIILTFSDAACDNNDLHTKIVGLQLSCYKRMQNRSLTRKTINKCEASSYQCIYEIRKKFGLRNKIRHR